MRRNILVVMLLCIACGMQAKVQKLASPNGKLKMEVNVGNDLSLRVMSGSEVLVDRLDLALQVGNERLGQKPKLKNAKRTTINNEIRNAVPMKNATTRNHANELTLRFADDYSLVLRAYNNGVAWRFVIDKKGTVDIVNEPLSMNFDKAFGLHLSPVSSFVTSCEEFYQHINTESYAKMDKMTYLPVLFESPQGVKMLFSEADLQDYPCMFLCSSGKNKVASVFPKAPEAWEPAGDRGETITREGNYIARTNGQRALPWRYFVVGSDADIAANEMGRCLAAPCEIDDTSWIKPGKVSWDWWNCWSVWNVDFETGINNETYKYFIDFASEYGVEYILLDEGWCKDVRNPFENIDVIDVQELVDYGRKKGVGVWLWMTWLAVEQHPEVIEHYAKMGVKGLKIDFMDHSDQWMVNFYERTTRECAKHHLMVDFHGAFKPAGLEYRYPNLLTYEGVRGLEQCGGCTPDNSIWLPFMRNAVGAMDFTPGSMASLQPEHYVVSRSATAGMGTRAYQMALYVVFESGLQMLADSPTRYIQADECTRFISSVPVTWDETRILSAKAGNHIVMARRSGSKWFVGAITGSEPQDITIPLDFLTKNARMTAFRDGANAHRLAVDYRKEQRDVTPQQTLSVHLVKNGGWCAVFE